MRPAGDSSRYFKAENVFGVMNHGEAGKIQMGSATQKRRGPKRLFLTAS
jgi:hypothetical protein